MAERSNLQAALDDYLAAARGFENILLNLAAGYDRGDGLSEEGLEQLLFLHQEQIKRLCEDTGLEA